MPLTVADLITLVSLVWTAKVGEKLQLKSGSFTGFSIG